MRIDRASPPESGAFRTEGLALPRLKGNVMSHDQEVTLAAAAGEHVIVAGVVPDARRAEFLPSKFGVMVMLKVETSIFAWMERLCPAYSGGHWNFVELSNGGA